MPASLTLYGAIYKIFPTQRFGDTLKRKFWVKEVNTKYPNIWSLEMWHDNVDILDDFKEAELVSCNVVVMGRISQSRNGSGDTVFNIIQCIDIQRV